MNTCANLSFLGHERALPFLATRISPAELARSLALAAAQLWSSIQGIGSARLQWAAANRKAAGINAKLHSIYHYRF